MHIIIIYIGILFGIFLEGEMIMISSVIAAHHGYLNLWIVVILGVLGIYCSVGYLFGEVIKSKLGHIEHIEKYIIGFILLLGILLIVINRVKRTEKTQSLI